MLPQGNKRKRRSTTYRSAYSQGDKKTTVGCLRGIMVKAMDCRIVVMQVRNLLPLLRSLLNKYHWERKEPSYPPSYWLKSTTTVFLEG